MNDFKYISYYLDKPLRQGRVYDIFVPEKDLRDTAIFIVHGGGWNGGSRLQYHTLMEAFADRGYIVASTDYRLTVPATEQLKDIQDAYLHFCRFLKDSGRPLKVFVHGSSAGAHLASLLACGDKSGIENWVAPQGVTLQACPASFVPWDEIFPAVWSAMQRAAGCAYSEKPEVYEQLSLDHQITPGDPQLFFMEAECEHMFWPCQKLQLARKIADAGNQVKVKIYPKVEHGFIYSLERTQQIAAFEDIIKFIENEKIENCTFSTTEGETL